jgi:hypothetical protein
MLAGEYGHGLSKRQNANDDSVTVYIVPTRTYYKSPLLLIGSILTIFEINNVIMKIKWWGDNQ